MDYRQDFHILGLDDSIDGDIGKSRQRVFTRPRNKAWLTDQRKPFQNRNGLKNPGDDKIRRLYPIGGTVEVNSIDVGFGFRREANVQRRTSS